MPWVVAYIPKNIPNDGGYVDPEHPENNRPAASEDKIVKAEIFSESTDDKKYREIPNFTNTEAFKNQSKAILEYPFLLEDKVQIDNRIIL
jgi:hypothetical protein